MQIELIQGQAMWFLGEPQKLKVSLTLANPGPISLDFNLLNKIEQKQVLLGIRGGKIRSDISFDELFQEYNKEILESPPPPEVKKYLDKQASVQDHQKQTKAVKQEKERRQKIQERCDYLKKQTIRGVKSVLSKEKDIRLLRAFLEIERKNKNRVSVIEFVEQKIRKFQKEVAVNIDQHEGQRSAISQPTGSNCLTYSHDVIESEEKTITLTDKMIALAQGSGGER
jgi:hypothetical protein